MDSFLRLGLAEPLSTAFESLGFDEPTAVQKEAIPVLLSRKDAIVESETGTGKTFAYLAPAFQLASVLDRAASGEPGALIVAPTQELAVQIGRESERLAKAASLPIKTAVLLGGTSLEKQAAKLKSKPDIVVGTLGRLADLVSLGKIRMPSIKILVLDEADRLFARETEELAIKLLGSASPSCVRVLVSATIPEKLRKELRPMLRDAVEVSPLGESVLSSDIEHWCFYCDGRKRLDFARRFEAAVHPARCLLFLSAASRVEKSALALEHLGLPIAAIHSGMDKESRRVALERFAEGEVRYLLTSDLGARGLDIAGISHVISLDLPEEPTIYTHRAGRTGRAGAKGVSIVLADGVELARASKLATHGGFVFRCKILEESQVLEPTAEEFFARAEAAETQRMEAKASKAREGEGRTGALHKKFDRSDRSDRDDRDDRGDRGRKDDALRDRRTRASAPEEPPEAPRTARKPDSAPWRPHEAGAAKKASDYSGPRLRKKSEIVAPAKAAARSDAEAPAKPYSARHPSPGERGGSRPGRPAEDRGKGARHRDSSPRRDVGSRRNSDDRREAEGRRDSYRRRDEERGREDRRGSPRGNAQGSGSSRGERDSRRPAQSSGYARKDGRGAAPKAGSPRGRGAAPGSGFSRRRDEAGRQSEAFRRDSARRDVGPQRGGTAQRGAAPRRGGERQTEERHDRGPRREYPPRRGTEGRGGGTGHKGPPRKSPGPKRPPRA